MTKFTEKYNNTKRQIIYITLAICFALTTSGCSSSLLLVKYLDEIILKLEDNKLIEVKNSNYTFTYKNSDGKIIFDNLGQPLSFTNGLAVIEKDGKYGLVNQSGQYVIEPIYDYISDFQDEMSAFLIQDITGEVKIGYFNTKGEVAIEPKVSDLQPFSCDSYDYDFYNGLALYRDPQNHKFGFIDKTGALVIENIYDYVLPFYEELTPVTKGDNYGYINTKNEIVIPFRFVLADRFCEDLAAVFDGKTWGYIDKTGNYAIPSQFGSFEGHDGELMANLFNNGYTGVYLGTGQAYFQEEHPKQFAIIDKTGKILNNERYDYLEMQPPGYFVKQNGKTFYLNNFGIKTGE